MRHKSGGIKRNLGVGWRSPLCRNLAGEETATCMKCRLQHRMSCLWNHKRHNPGYSANQGIKKTCWSLACAFSKHPSYPSTATNLLMFHGPAVLFVSFLTLLCCSGSLLLPLSLHCPHFGCFLSTPPSRSYQTLSAS